MSRIPQKPRMCTKYLSFIVYQLSHSPLVVPKPTTYVQLHPYCACERTTLESWNYITAKKMHRKLFLLPSFHSFLYLSSVSWKHFLMKETLIFLLHSGRVWDPASWAEAAAAIKTFCCLRVGMEVWVRLLPGGKGRLQSSRRVSELYSTYYSHFVGIWWRKKCTCRNIYWLSNAVSLSLYQRYTLTQRMQIRVYIFMRDDKPMNSTLTRAFTSQPMLVFVAPPPNRPGFLNFTKLVFSIVAACPQPLFDMTISKLVSRSTNCLIINSSFCLFFGCFPE